MSLFSMVGDKANANAGAKFMSGGTQQGTGAPVLPGLSRGQSGSQGAQFSAHRNVDAGADKERDAIMEALGLGGGEPLKLPFTSNKIKAMQRYR